MTDNLIGPKPNEPMYPTPWQASNWGNLEDASGYTLYFAANGVPLEESKKLGPAIVDAVNAYYGGTGPLQDTWVKACRDLDAKDTRIVNLEGRAQVAEELVKKLQKEAGARNERWAIMVREVDKRDARIADLERKLKRAHDTMSDLHRDKDDAEKRAEAAEARVKELEREYYLTARSVGFGWQIKADRDTFAAPDGRVFRVGQRVKGVLSGLFSTIVGINGEGLITKYNSGIANTGVPAENLRRVWDGTEEPDVPVGTVIRGADGLRLGRLPGGWSLYHSGTGNWSGPNEWDDWDHSEEVRPYVEWLPGDDE